MAAAALEGLVSEKIVQWPAQIARNFDANGAPCAEPGQIALVVVHVILVLQTSVGFIEMQISV